MTRGLIVVEPVVITDSVMTASTIAEDDYALWDSGTAYTSGQRVRRTNHRIYQATTSSTGSVPETTPSKWTEVSPTMRWRPFDREYYNKATVTDGASYTLAPGRVVNAVGVLGLSGGASSVRVRQIDPLEGTVFDRTKSVTGVIPEASWYDWFFAETFPQSSALFLDLLPYGSADVQIDIEGDGATSFGPIVVGYQREYGIGVEIGAEFEMQDFSIKEQNEFGEWNLTRRPTSDRISMPMKIRKGEFPGMRDTFRRLRTTPCLYIGSERRAETVVYGMYSGFGVSVSYPSYNEIEILITGLAEQ